MTLKYDKGRYCKEEVKDESVVKEISDIEVVGLLVKQTDTKGNEKFVIVNQNVALEGCIREKIFEGPLYIWYRETCTEQTSGHEDTNTKVIRVPK